jgi:cell wall-associated NlpC family hydrolase
VVREALSWVGTPYHPRARLKGVGVDCGLFIAAVFEESGQIRSVDVPSYVGDEHMHSPDEAYLRIVLAHAKEIKFGKQRPGDVCLWKFGQRLSHGAIVTEWPRVVHATRLERRVWECDLTQDVRYPPDQARYFSAF